MIIYLNPTLVKKDQIMRLVGYSLILTIRVIWSSFFLRVYSFSKIWHKLCCRKLYPLFIWKVGDMLGVHRSRTSSWCRGVGVVEGKYASLIFDFSLKALTSPYSWSFLVFVRTCPYYNDISCCLVICTSMLVRSWLGVMTVAGCNIITLWIMNFP